MKSRMGVFNIFLLALGCALAPGCDTAGQKKKHELSTLTLHREVNRDGTGKSEPVPIRRQNPIYLNVEKIPFLTEANLLKAAVVEQPGGFAILAQFDGRGTKLLEIMSGYDQGKHFAIFSTFGEVRWLAAPLFTRRNTTGTIAFTPDATREEAERIVRGLNNAVKQNKKSSAVGLFPHE